MFPIKMSPPMKNTWPQMVFHSYFKYVKYEFL